MKKTVLWITVVLVFCIFISGCSSPSNSKPKIEWKDVSVPASTPELALAWILENAQDGNSCTVNLDGGNYELPSNNDLGFNDNRNVKIIITAASPVTITLKSGEKGYLFGVGKNITLVLENNISLTGVSSNTRTLVEVWENGTLEMKEGSKISGNKLTAADRGGGAILVYGGHFTMSGGIIENNDAIKGGGVGIIKATFTMTGGEIKNNKATSESGGGVWLWDNANFTMSGGKIESNETKEAGGGVYVGGISSFSMSGGEIKNNIAEGGGGIGIGHESQFTMSGNALIEANISDEWGGGGISVFDKSTFTMTNGEIKNNTTTGGGGGVCISEESQFTMSGTALILSNEAGIHGGGGVMVCQESTFTMKGGTIKLNTEPGQSGGGVAVWDPSTNFIMESGTIEQNKTLTNDGGGVVVGSFGIFTMKGGTIKENTAQVNGGGVFVCETGAHFIMEGGSIEQNTATTGTGGGVFIWQSSFSKTGQSVISGNSAFDMNKNVSAESFSIFGYRTADIPAGENISAEWDGSNYTFSPPTSWDP